MIAQSRPLVTHLLERLYCVAQSRQGAEFHAIGVLLDKAELLHLGDVYKKRRLFCRHSPCRAIIVLFHTF